MLPRVRGMLASLAARAASGFAAPLPASTVESLIVAAPLRHLLSLTDAPPFHTSPALLSNLLQHRFASSGPGSGGGGPRGRGRNNNNNKNAQRRLPERNNEIRSPELRVVFPEEERLPTVVLSLAEAKQEAQKRGLDLVMMSPYAKPPVARLVEWDKVLYSLRQKEKAAERAARESKKLMAPKEVRVGCLTADHDLGVKLEAARRFLTDGQHLRLVVTFRGGRQIDPGRQRLEEVLQALGPLAVVKDPRQLQRPQMNQWVVQLAPGAAPAAA